MAPLQRTRRTGSAGFTLLELLAAMLAGLFVVLAAFSITRSASRLFGSENRIADTQLNLRVGVEQLRLDLQRAGFQASANPMTDPNVFPNLQSDSRVHFQAIVVGQGSAANNKLLGADVLTKASLYPDYLVVAGNFATTDNYLVAAVDADRSPVEITLQVKVGSTTRLLAVGSQGSRTDALRAAFPAGRLLQLRNTMGSSQYLVIAERAPTVDGNNRIVVYVNDTAPLPQVSRAAPGANPGAGGVSGLCTGCEINTVQLFRYSIQSLAGNGNFISYYGNDAGVDTDKTDLVREELDPTATSWAPGDGAIAGTQQIIAEYAVDLGFAVSVDSSAAPANVGNWVNPVVTDYGFGDPNNYTVAGDLASNNTATRPQRVRSVRYRLSIRNRDADRSASAGDNAGPFAARFPLGTDRFARVRTITGEVTLINLRGIRW